MSSIPFINGAGDLCVYLEDLPAGTYTARGRGPVGVRIYGRLAVDAHGNARSTITDTDTGATKAARSEYRLDEVQIPEAIPFTPGQWAHLRRKPAAS